MKKAKTDYSLYRWNPTSIQCYLLKSNCSQCPVARLGLETLPPCHMAKALETILKIQGPPDIAIHAETGLFYDKRARSNRGGSWGRL